MQHLDDTWLVIVAQPKPISRMDLFSFFISTGKLQNTPADKRKFEHACNHLHTKGNIHRMKADGIFHYFYDDDCLMRPVTGLRFSKALDCGEFTFT